MKILFVISAICAIALALPSPKVGSGKIVNGEAVDITDYPYQVSFRRGDQHICGGSIIDQWTVLTAAHCVEGMENSPGSFNIRVGNNYNYYGDYYGVYQIIKNPRFNPKVIDNDLAVVKLSQGLVWSDSVRPIQLVGREKHVPVGTNVVVTGWGYTYEGENRVSDELRGVGVQIISQQDCENMLRTRLSTHEVCAWANQRDSCQGDSGGPLAAGNYLIGVVSWGQGCARGPGVYAKVSDWENHDFITSYMN